MAIARERNLRLRANFIGTKNCGGEKRSGESEGGQKFLPPNPLPFCPPERKSFCSCRAKLGNQNSQSGFSSKKVRISSNKHHSNVLATKLECFCLDNNKSMPRLAPYWSKANSAGSGPHLLFHTVFK